MTEDLCMRRVPFSPSDFFSRFVNRRKGTRNGQGKRDGYDLIPSLPLRLISIVCDMGTGKKGEGKEKDERVGGGGGEKNSTHAVPMDESIVPWTASASYDMPKIISAPPIAKKILKRGAEWETRRL